MKQNIFPVRIVEYEKMWWVIILCDYFFETKAYDFTKRQLKYLQDLIALFDDYVNDNGEMLYPSYFVD